MKILRWRVKNAWKKCDLAFKNYSLLSQKHAHSLEEPWESAAQDRLIKAVKLHTRRHQKWANLARKLEHITPYTPQNP